MKLALTYTAAEAQKAAQTIALIQEHYPGVRVRKNERHAPFYHIYLTTGNPEKPRKPGKNA